MISKGRITMEPISSVKLFEFFMETLGHCGTFLLDASMEDIEWHVFEEFDSESITFLHEDSLERLLDLGYISVEVCRLCRLLRMKFRSLEGTSLWNVEAVRTSREWYEILSLADEIKGMVRIKS